jgi:hypothetical protein
MARVTPIRVIATTYTSARDLNGNCYHWARFINPTRGRHTSVVINTGGESNAVHLAWLAAGEDHEGTHCTQVVQAKRDWKRGLPDGMMYEGTEAANRAMARLFPRFGKAWREEKAAEARRRAHYEQQDRERANA